MEQKRSYGDAFKYSPLQRIQAGDFCVEHTVYKVLKAESCKSYLIKTAQNSNFSYSDCIIKETATSATLYTSEKKATKTELVELFSDISLNDIWFAVFLKQDDDKDWPEKLVTQIRSIEKEEAIKYVKKDCAIFGKIKREIAGQKIALQSDNNFYMVRDLNIYFDELARNGQELALKKSIRKLDVNTLQSLIFNNMKYVLK